MFWADLDNAEIKNHTYGRYQFDVCIADDNGRDWYDHDWPESQMCEVVELTRSRLKPGATVFDLGAHQGIVAMMLAREVGPTGRVIAVDAHPHNVQVARRNFDINGFLHCEIINAAVSNAPGRIKFVSDLNGQVDKGDVREKNPWASFFEVDAITINALIEHYGHPDVIMLDVEGAEFLALEGASKAFEKPIDFYVEIHQTTGLETMGGSVQQVLSYFPEDRFDMTIRTGWDDAFRARRLDEDFSQFGHFWIVATAK
ncbi:FkbM family methyltransferase [Asticcacaulis sp. AND118]|uniref:FkbM family methyltransferase n=1 Tax=Asticcacaulis sp. AND118 TaxID=2840468 RepID=UPI001D000AD6|nr:FkbM family methyltransferase [Asticcacaulis sp. AND118]UDF03396.1 FkbM family methyltransferase [Asticcacaulis sp. AND118]